MNLIKRSCKPNFFIAGMPRSGTTSLYIYLKQHPEIYLSVYKEPLFFGRDLTQTAYQIRDETLYYSLFTDAGGIERIGEASVWYLTSKTAAAEIKQFNPSSKIIVMLRDPLDMIHSLHSLYVRTGNEDSADFPIALELQQKRMKGLSIPKTCYFPEGLFYTEIAKYYEKVKRFVDEFGRENIHCIIFDDFVADPAHCYRKTLEFLEVNASFQAEFDLKKAADLIRPLVLRQLRDTTPEIRKWISIKNGKDIHRGPPRAPLPLELKLHLKKHFKEDLVQTGQLIKRNLLHWCSE